MNEPKAEVNIIGHMNVDVEVIVAKGAAEVVAKIGNDREDLIAAHPVNIIPDHRDIDQVEAEVVIENDRLIVIHQEIDTTVDRLVRPKNCR